MTRMRYGARHFFAPTPKTIKVIIMVLIISVPFIQETVPTMPISDGAKYWIVWWAKWLNLVSALLFGFTPKSLNDQAQASVK